MKKHFLSLFLGMLSLQLVQAQDIITKRTGESVQAKVLEITPGEVKYRRYERPDGPLYTIAKADVLLIQYEDKSEDIFETDGYVPPAEPTQQAAITNYYGKGQMDAENFYQNYKGASTGTLIASLVSPLVGLIPAIACSTTPPKEHNLDYPSHELMQHQDYQSGYKQRSRKIKSKKVWTNWGIALGVNVVLVYMLSQ